MAQFGMGTSATHSIHQRKTGYNHWQGYRIHQRKIIGVREDRVPNLITMLASMCCPLLSRPSRTDMQKSSKLSFDRAGDLKARYSQVISLTTLSLQVGFRSQLQEFASDGIITFAKLQCCRKRFLSYSRKMQKYCLYVG